MGRIKCLCCGNKYRSITNTHLSRHNLTLKEYIKKYNLNPSEWGSKKFLLAKIETGKTNVKLMNKAIRKLAKEGKLWIQSKEGRKLNSERMKTNNPMSNKNVSNQVKNKLIEKYKHETHPNKGRKRPDFSEWLKKNNPMKDELYASLVLSRSRKTLVKQGNISKGERMLYHLMDALSNHFNFKYEKQHPVLSYIIDVAIPNKKIAIEYDGHQRHYKTNEDTLKDIKLLDCGWRILRIGRNHMFTSNVGNEIWNFINNREKRTCLGHKL